MSTLPGSLPPPRTPSPRDAPTLRWGIMAPGQIANRFVDALRAHTDQRVVATGSRSRERAEAFRRKHGLDRAYGSYEELAQDPEVDAVYVAAPNSAHLALGLLAIQGGKHVLIEKPFTCTADEARELAAAARAGGTFCMEAMWARYLPQADVLRQVLDEGLLGEIRFVSADHGQSIPTDTRLYDPELGGGALLDLGVYPVSFAHWVLGPPSRTTAHGTLTANGLDDQAVVTLEYATGAIGTATTSMIARTPTVAAIAGLDALLEFDGPFYVPGGLSVSQAPDRGGASLRWSDETGITLGEGLCYQATALARYVAEGRTESPVLGLDESIAVIETLDEARHQLGAYLPMEARA